jgi:glycosyltransferase involved in cell wall biosynthesis
MNNKYLNKKIAVVAAGSIKGEIGGAENFYDGLVTALGAMGCAVELINFPADESSFDRILENYSLAAALDLSAYDMVISTKAPTYAINHPNHVLYLVHTTRVFYDMFDTAFASPDDTLRRQRDTIQRMDTEIIARIPHRFSIGHEVSARMEKYNEIQAEVLHPPLARDGFFCGEAGDFFLLPGRLHPWKRVDLVIRAVKLSMYPLKLVITGTGEAEQALRQLAGDDQRITFLGRVSDIELQRLYATALAVPFVPVREDYGYVTLEAFASGKPVVTCCDSGEPLQFVKHNETGLICEPDAESLCYSLEYLFNNRSEAQRLGLCGLKSVEHITWPNVATRLLAAGFASGSTNAPTQKRGLGKTNVAVLDMQPIEPAVGGGRLRLLGLYHALGDEIDARYIGTYDWPGEKFRQHHLTPSLEEIDVPLSDAHHIAASTLAAEAGGKTVIDISFPRLCHLSPEYLDKASEAIAWADVVIFSHPWVFPLVADQLKTSQLVVYDSQNVEGFLRAQLLDEENPVEAQLLREVVEAEYALGCRADMILACSQEDLELFARIYDWPAVKMRVIPNAVMASKITPPSEAERARAKRSVGISIERKAAIFIGSAYQPNVEAAKFIAQELAPHMPNCDFIVAGGVGKNVGEPVPANVIITGYIDDKKKLAWLHSADFAINPMFSGSGTNIKMFDFMAAGLPVVSTQIGARGIKTAGRHPILIVENNVHAFVGGIRDLIERPDVLKIRSIDARAAIEDEYSWERISAQLGSLLTDRKRGLARQKPAFTVVIPTYDRHSHLDEIVKCLQGQLERSFEVVMVDQSPVPWSRRYEDFGFPLTYVHTTVKGAVRARNTGALFSQGAILAFTDDDCRPDSNWLLAARPYFDDPGVQAVEGIIESDHLDDPNFRPVTNVGFEGIGFMTANLVVRAEAFIGLGGFDLSFDHPHFREDTDFGWRVQGLGEIPYARDVRVFHPAQPRQIERESAIERAKFFEKDAILYGKHPDSYRRLFLAEGHWAKTEGFWENLERGALKYGVDISSLMSYKRERNL